MAGPSSLKTLPVFSSNSSSSSSSSSFMKLKTLMQTLILSRLYRIARALTKAKYVLVQVIKDVQLVHLIEFPSKKNKNKQKVFFSSFRLHYNWEASQVMPVLEDYSKSHVSYESDLHLNTMSMEYDGIDGSELSAYLEWLDEQDSSNEIDKLADLFIANSHEQFMLEKQESYRRFQEMMARSI